MALVRRLCLEVDMTRLATDLLVGVLRTLAYFAVGAMVMALLAGCLVLSVVANSPR